MQFRIAAFCSMFLALLSCAPGPTAVTAPREFTKKGEVVFLQGSAAWDDHQVLGPLISVSRRTDGSWAGTLNKQALDVNVYSARAAGAFLTMKWDEHPNQLVITAQWEGRLHRFEVYSDRVLFRGPTRSFTLQHRRDGSFGPGGELKFSGQARDPRPPMPQFGLALLATFLDGLQGIDDLQQQRPLRPQHPSTR